MRDRLRILFSGMIAGDPHQGGATWAVLQYLLGLRRLGHDVLFVEPLKSSPGAASRSYFQSVVAEFNLNAALLHATSGETLGIPYSKIAEFADSCDLLINISGMLTGPLIEKIPRRVYLDLDPAFLQCWQDQGIDMRFAAHTHFVTIGREIGQPACPVPTSGKAWLPTLPPVALSEWPVAERIIHDAYTTIGNWRGYGSVTHNGEFYGQKAHSFRRLLALPQRTAIRFEPALAIHPGETDDLTRIAAHGWTIRDPATLAATPGKYRDFVQGSRGEFGLAKSGYVSSHCGWFSDRSAVFLASGRPVLAQRTGFEKHLPTGEGLLGFSDLDDLVAAAEAVEADYPRHRRAARQIAIEHFDSDRVLSSLLDRVGGAA